MGGQEAGRLQDSAADSSCSAGLVELSMNMPPGVHINRRSWRQYMSYCTHLSALAEVNGRHAPLSNRGFDKPGARGISHSLTISNVWAAPALKEQFSDSTAATPEEVQKILEVSLTAGESG